MGQSRFKKRLVGDVGALRGTRVFTHTTVTPNVRNQAHLACDEELSRRFLKPATKISLCHRQRGMGFMSNGTIIIVAGHHVG